MPKRYIIEKTQKAVAVIDSKHPRYKPNVGLLVHEEPWILAYWFESIFDDIQPELITKAELLCNLLNKGDDAIETIRDFSTDKTMHNEHIDNEHALGDPHDTGEKIEENIDGTENN